MVALIDEGGARAQELFEQHFRYVTARLAAKGSLRLGADSAAFSRGRDYPRSYLSTALTLRRAGWSVIVGR